MNPLLKFSAATAAIFVIALVGFGLLRGGGASIGGPGTSPATSPTDVVPSSSAAAAVPRACALLANAEVATALNLSSQVTSGPASGSNGDVDYCVYHAAGADVVGLSYRHIGGGSVFDTWSQGTGVQTVSGLGDRAVWDPTQDTLFVLKGDRLVSIEGGTTPMTLQTATAIGAILAGRM